MLGVKTELIGLALCLAFGFAFGIIYGSVEHWSEGFWLTDEMIARYVFFQVHSFLLFDISGYKIDR